MKSFFHVSHYTKVHLQQKRKIKCHGITPPTQHLGAYIGDAIKKPLVQKNNLKNKNHLWSHLPLTDIESTFCSSPKMLLLSECTTLCLCVQIPSSFHATGQWSNAILPTQVFGVLKKIPSYTWLKPHFLYTWVLLLFKIF